MTDIVDRLDAMFTDDEGRDDRLMISIHAADEIRHLREELAEAKELLADSIPRLVEGYRLRAENVELRGLASSLEGRLEASRDFCDLYRTSIADALAKLDNPYLTNHGCAEAAGMLRKAVGR